MNRRRLALSAAAALAALALGPASRALAQPAPSAGVSSIDRYTGRIQLKRKDGTTVELQVRVRNWIIPARTRLDRFPEEGTLEVQLRGGTLFTTINGERRERAEDEFWLVPAGVPMAIETAEDSVTLQTVATVSL